MSDLGDLLRDMIAADGPITLERYMALALGHPAHGYYTTRDPFGAAGDFVTAPEISQMFGELVGLWSAQVWASMGQPLPIKLVELGPGRGTLMRDALRAARVVPDFRNAIDVHLVETSPVLREAQRASLADAGLPVAWHQHLDEVPAGPAIILANEFFDALPVRHYFRTSDGWHERMVGFDDDGALVFGVTPQTEAAISIPAEAGSILEVGAEGQRIAAALAARIARDGGAALVFDYGHTETALGETLQAVKAHAFVDPLESPGEADLTTHVDFAALARATQLAGVEVFGPVKQGAFLIRLGIVERARALAAAPGSNGSGIEAALLRLVSDAQDISVGDRQITGMGSLFKVLCIAQAGLPLPPGFETAGTSR